MPKYNSKKQSDNILLDEKMPITQIQKSREILKKDEVLNLDKKESLQKKKMS